MRIGVMGNRGIGFRGRGRLEDSPPPPKPQTGHNAWQQAAEPEESAGRHLIVCPGECPQLPQPKGTSFSVETLHNERFIMLATTLFSRLEQYDKVLQ
ncbi:Homeobox protein zampogna [Frankliniella fusca]|uniref:Homeobox protein zampogna n=1 Tax=Frankliniella fusca TaxID=407009 RepID=A0AAE1I1U2_9NEOP|nr:Homeobox protein zampogna [Frankliniella fusca]